MPGKYRYLLFIVLFLGVFVSSEAQFKKFEHEIDSYTQLSIEESIQSEFSSYSIVDSIISLGKTFLGKPYKYKTNLPWALDCSGYLAFIYSKFNINLPRSSRGLFNETESIDIIEVQKGDLLFFKGRNLADRTVGHVSMVIEVNPESIKMMHSCSRGIIIDELEKSNYYKQRFLKAGRISKL